MFTKGEARFEYLSFWCDHLTFGHTVSSVFMKMFVFAMIFNEFVGKLERFSTFYPLSFSCNKINILN